MSEIADAILALSMKHEPHRWFDWMVDDCLASFGRRIESLPPENAREDLFNLSSLYGKCVSESEPFTDVLGDTYQTLSYKYKQKSMGQYFTPEPVAQMMAQFTYEPKKITDDLCRVFEPCVGSGVMLLMFCRVVALNQGISKLENFSFTGIDLDQVCVKMAATQMMANAYLHQFSFGELVFYHGNSLGDVQKLKPIYHVSHTKWSDRLKDLPAKSPERLEAIEAAVAVKGEQFSLFDIAN